LGIPPKIPVVTSPKGLHSCKSAENAKAARRFCLPFHASTTRLR